MAYGVPCISGKDSMKNDYTGGGKKISIPPTVLFSVLGIMDDVKKAVTSDFKKPGDRLYIIGNTARELAGSEIADQLGIACNTVPRVDAKSALASYRKLHQAINSRLISACHDLSDGGLAVSLAEMCIGGRLGAHLALNRVPYRRAHAHGSPYSESAKPAGVRGSRQGRRVRSALRASRALHRRSDFRCPPYRGLRRARCSPPP